MFLILFLTLFDTFWQNGDTLRVVWFGSSHVLFALKGYSFEELVDILAENIRSWFDFAPGGRERPNAIRCVPSFSMPSMFADVSLPQTQQRPSQGLGTCCVDLHIKQCKE